ncbi:hypothetical protein PUW79_13095 [Microbacterium sp. NE2HP2]|uniref:Uncharacterized protein n=1 Tax=Microbacterium plantarum TaxID=1816425 RepID=A0ABV5EMT8_9MICO|nr:MULTISPECIES: hypothetical protein [Microbacterium]MDD7945572.1 hypothetical protein [Microbacterium plantarum]RAZ30651.1 hypothetical protein DO944_14045 [Microbacterium sp. SMR1]WHE35840.1 hypothetical protein P6897_14280 [Microbacterium sp. BDGP8]WRK17010.1 hypothetical protein VC184_14035 [Microbacterium plantarum]
MSTPSGGMRPGLATAFAVVGFGALAICGLGILSLVTGQDVVAVRGLGPIPGAVGFGAAVIAIAATLATVLRVPRPSYAISVPVGIVALLSYLAGLVVAALLVGVDAARALAAAGGFAVSWFGVLLVAAAAISGWTAVALVRTRATPPRWAWERDEDE